MEEFFSSILIITSMFGYGVVTLPIATAYIGTMNSLILLSFFALITGLSIDLLFKSCEISNSKSYNDLTRKNIFIFALGQLTFFLCGFFSTIGYADKILTYTERITSLNRNYILIMFCFIQASLSFLKTLDRLKYVSYFSIGACTYIIMLTLYYGIVNRENTNRDVSSPQYSKGIGSFCFALCCQNIVPSVYQNLKNKSRSFLVPIFTVIIASLLFGTMAIGGFYAGGDGLKNSNIQDILDFFLVMNQSKMMMIFNNVGVTFFIILLNCSSFFQMFPVRNMVMSMFMKSNMLTILFSMIWISTIALVLFFNIDLSNIINLTGAYITSTLAYILPPIIYLNIANKYEIRYLLTAGSVFMVGVGAIGYFTYENFISS